MFRKIICLGIALAMVFSMAAGCTADIDGKYNGLSVGFNYEHPKTLPSVIGAFRSSKVQFNVNEVTVDFYYGWQTNPPKAVEHEEFYMASVAFYVYNPLVGMGTIQDEVWHSGEREKFFIIEVPMSEFVLEEYKVTITKREGKQFKNKTSFTIPQELFQSPEIILGETMEIWLGYIIIWHSYDDGISHYEEITVNRHRVEMRFEFIDEKTVCFIKN